MAALTDSWLLGVWVVVFFVVLQQLEGILFAPADYGENYGIVPVSGSNRFIDRGKIAGFIGFLLAIPLAIIIQEIFDESVRRKTQVKV